MTTQAHLRHRDSHTPASQFPWQLWAIVLLAVGLRCGVAVLTRSWVFSSAHNFWAYGYEMGQIAASLANGHGFAWPGPPPEPTAWMPPVYPAIMAGAFWLWGTFSPSAAVALEVLQIGAAAVTCLLLYQLGTRLWHPQAGLWAAALFAVYPPAIHFAVQKIWATSVFTACFLGCLLLMIRIAERPSLAHGLWLGVLLAVTVLLDPVALGAYPFLLAWLWWHAAGERRVRTHTVVAVVLVLVVGITPWMIRNTLVFRQFTFIKSNFGHELYLGNNVKATGYYGDHVRAIQDELTGDVPTVLLTDAERDIMKTTNEAQHNALYQRKAIDYIAGHPSRFLQLTATRTLLFWLYVPYTQTWQGLITLLTYLSVLLAALAGFCVSGWNTAARQLLWLSLFTLPAPYYLTLVAHGRYRFTVEVLLMIGAGVALAWATTRVSQRLAVLSQTVQPASSYLQH